MIVVRPIRAVRSDTTLVEPVELIMKPSDVFAAKCSAGGAVSNIPTGGNHHEPYNGTI